MGYDPHASGLLTGGGARRFKARANVIRGENLKHFPNVHISDVWSIKREIPDFDPALEFEYTRRELLLLAEKILLEDQKPPYEEPAWLNGPTMNDRIKREIYCSAGTPDPSIVEGMYWRTHPQGRPWLSEDERRGSGASFYGTKRTSKEAIPAPPKRVLKKCRFKGCSEDARVKGLCYAHRGQERLGISLRPIKRHVGLSKFALREKDMIDRAEAKKRTPEGVLSN
jgi:hypothetical protein